MENSFTVELPSWGSTKYFPNNKGHSYITQLSSPLTLENDWEVAILEMDYHHAWNTLEKDQWLTFIVERDDLKGKFNDALVTGKEGKKTLYEYSIPIKYGETFRIEYDPELPKSYDLVNIKIPAGHYGSQKDIASIIEKEIEKQSAEFKVYDNKDFKINEVVKFEFN